MKSEFEHTEIEPRWQKKWADEGSCRWRNDPNLDKYYVLEMFPYTSGRMHIGHARNYTMGDVLARMYRARGFDVIYPMGWDAFGLPAENAAIVNGTPPRLFTDSAIKAMKVAMLKLGLSYDWACEINTSASDYIAAQQRLFIRFFKAGLVYRDTSFVNWCDSCGTVLANEQASSGVCWRCESDVSKRRVPQWFFDIRRYADELVDGLDDLPGWPDSVKNIQRAWVGRSAGTEIEFDVEGSTEPLRVFTTRPDTLCGCTYMVVAPEHKLLDSDLLPEARRAAVSEFRDRVLHQSIVERSRHDQAKEGVFTGLHAINPINGQRVPLWTANYVLMEYGAGAVMAVPAHDQRDFEFAREKGLPVRTVILGDGMSPDDELAMAHVGEGVLTNSGPFDGLHNEAAKDAITEALADKQKGSRSIQFRLQNWSVSRQRNWGNPVPIIHCDACGSQPAPESDLPILPLEGVDVGVPGSPASSTEPRLEATCPACGGKAHRDPDTMDTFVDSSWYFIRFTSARCSEPFDSDTVNRMLPVDLYIGGVEHATLHLMYARFFVKVLRDLGLVGFDEPFLSLHNHGMVNDEQGRKQSKSLGNVVEPTNVIERFGADALRVYLMFATAYDAPLDWSNDGPRDAKAYLNRVWRLSNLLEDTLAAHPGLQPDMEICKSDVEVELGTLVYKTIAKVTRDIERFQFNTAIAALMALTNAISTYPRDEAAQQPVAAAYRVLVRLLGVFAPHVAEELWSRIGGEGMVVDAAWPICPSETVVTRTKEIAVQLNGKLVVSIIIAQEVGEEQILEAALAEPKMTRRMEGKTICRVIHVPDRLVNVVAS